LSAVNFDRSEKDRSPRFRACGVFTQPGSKAPRTIKASWQRMSALLRKWTSSELARLFFTFAGWSVQPCVRPVSAAHKAAGHNALRGSGPGQNRAFDNALALVGCPDRRIDRLCITCCSPSQPSHHAGWPARSLTLQALRVPCSARPSPSWPKPFWRFCWRVR
jgi:hypothetical protein